MLELRISAASEAAYHVRNSQEEKGEALKSGHKQPAQKAKFLDEARPEIFGMPIGICICVYELQILKAERGHRSLVELSNFSENIDGLLVMALANQKLRRLVKSKYQIAGDEDNECDHANDDHFVAPAHIAGDSAARIAGIDTYSAAGGEFNVAPEFGSSTKGNGGCDDNPDRLPYTQQSNEKPPILWEKFQSDCRVDGDVAPEPDA